MMRREGFGDLLASAVGLALTLAISFVLVILLILLLSAAPAKAIFAFFIGPFTNSYYLGNMLNAAVPLVFTGLGISIAFKASVFNLGGEGQIYAGGLAATAVCLALAGRKRLGGRGDRPDRRHGCSPAPLRAFRDSSACAGTPTR